MRFKPKPLNTRFTLVPLMESSSYAGGGYSTSERSKLASRGISVVAGLAALVGATYSAMAQDVQPIAYENTNLAQYGVPNMDGMKPIATKWLDKTDHIPGNETRFDIFKLEDGLLGIYSIKGKQYSVAYDPDGKPPVDYGFIDKNGDGNYERMSGSKLFSAPDWVIR